MFLFAPGGAHEVLGRGAIFRAAPPSESVVLGYIGNFCTVVPTKPWFCGMIGHIQENLCVVPHEIQLGGAQLHRKVCYAPNLDLRERIILDVGTTSGKILYIPQY